MNLKWVTISAAWQMSWVLFYLRFSGRNATQKVKSVPELREDGMCWDGLALKREALLGLCHIFHITLEKRYNSHWQLCPVTPSVPSLAGVV